MGQCKIEDGDIRSYAYAVFRPSSCKFEHQDFKKAKERMLKKSYKPGGKKL
jgi:hypothetical protein